MFKIGDPKTFQVVSAGEVMNLPSAGFRNVRLAFNTNGPVDLWLDDPSGAVFVASGSGRFDVSFSINGDSVIYCDAGEDTVVRMRSDVQSARIVKRDVPSFATIEPRARRNSDMDRMMLAMRLNEERRDAQMAQAIEHMKMNAAVAPAATPEPAVIEPDPAKKEDDDEKD